MTLKDAQELIKKEGFAWTAVYVDCGDRFLTIGAKWKSAEYLMRFNADGSKLIHIETFK